MSKLVKYKLVNLPANQKYLVGQSLPDGKVSIDAISDDIAEKLYNQKSRYVELADKKEEKSK